MPLSNIHISTHFPHEIFPNQVQTKKRVVLATRFKCPFCATEESVECEMKLREGTGSLNCRMCGASFQMPIHHLHEPIDVFSEWLDECEAAEKRKNGMMDVGDDGDAIGGSHAMNSGMTNNGRRDYEYDSGEDDDLPDSSGLAGANDNNNSAKPQLVQQHSLATLGVGDSDDDSE